MAAKKVLRIPFNGWGDQLHYESDTGRLPERLEYDWKAMHELRISDTTEYDRLQQERAHWYERARQKTWRDNYEFDAALRFTAMSRGRSAAFFHLEDEQGHQYTMFMTDVLEILQRGEFADGYVVGRWTFCKRGANFGVKLV